MLYKSSIQSNSNKWKKRLINLSHKLQRSNNHWNASFSATAMAAATEKFIRHSTPPTTNNSSEIIIHSEDLTASQFANLTGIKTSYTQTYEDSEDDEEDEEDDDEEDEDDDDSRDYYTSSLSSCHPKSTQSMRIWDSHFWKDTKLPSSASMKDLTSTTTATTIAADEKLILTSQPLARHTSEPGGQRVPSMIQKGRFKIVWGGDDNEPITHPVPQCVEWKRKRAGSASTAIL